MKTQKAIAITMIISSSVLTAVVSRDVAYPAILCMLGLLGLRRRFTWNIRPDRRVIRSFLLLFLAAMFALQFRYAGFAGRIAYDQAAAVAWQTIARYFLASMILVLFLGSPQQLPSSLGLFHIGVTISAGQILLLDDLYLAFRLSELLSVVLLVLYATTTRRATQTLIPARVGRASHGFAFSLIFLVAANTGWITGTLLYSHVEVFNYLPVWFWGARPDTGGPTEAASLVGFSTSGKLSSILTIKGDLDASPVLDIRSDECPGYLRACAFEGYRQSEWSDLATKQEVFPEQNRPFGVYFAGRRNTFRLDDSDPDTCKSMAIQHVSRSADVLFTPLGTSVIEAPLRLVLRDDNNIVYAPRMRTGLGYRVGFRDQPLRKPPTSIQYRRMLDVPGRLDPRVYDLAEKIFAGCNTTAEKIDAVVQHFRKHYTYSLSMDIPPDTEDKVSYFLLNSSSGYCEYFASGAAILLRLADVPTRYVTGFLVTDHDDERDLWIARNMDAHAWVEAWDRQRNQWCVVEATVGENAAEAVSGDQIEHLGGSAAAMLRQLLRAVYEYGLLGVPSWLFESYGVVAGVSLLTSLLAAVLAWVLSRFYRKKKSSHAARSKKNADPILILLHKMLLRMDRKVKTAGLCRDPNETLHTFAHRLRGLAPFDGGVPSKGACPLPARERDSQLSKRRKADSPVWIEISDWYREYAMLRYRKSIDTQHVEHLQRRAVSIFDT
jgi:transglutaminase-like putative cysteine protease